MGLAHICTLDQSQWAKPFGSGPGGQAYEGWPIGWAMWPGQWASPVGLCPSPLGHAYGPGPMGQAQWARPNGSSPGDQAQWVRPNGPGSMGWAQWARPHGPGPLQPGSIGQAHWERFLFLSPMFHWAVAGTMMLRGHYCLNVRSNGMPKCEFWGEKKPRRFEDHCMRSSLEVKKLNFLRQQAALCIEKRHGAIVHG